MNRCILYLDDYYDFKTSLVTKSHFLVANNEQESSVDSNEESVY